MEWYFLSLKGLSAFQYSCHTFSLRTQDLPFPSMICTLGILKCVRIKHPFYQCERYSPHTHTCNTAWCCQNGKGFFSTDTLDHPVNPGRKICWFGFLKPALLHAVSKKKREKWVLLPILLPFNKISLAFAAIKPITMESFYMCVTLKYSSPSHCSKLTAVKHPLIET